MDNVKYNGWTNWETWCVNLWLTNDQGSDDMWRESARERLVDARLLDVDDEDKLTEEEEREDALDEAIDSLADRMENDIEEYAIEGLEGFRLDLMQGTLDNVDWREIARHYIEGEME